MDIASGWSQSSPGTAPSGPAARMRSARAGAVTLAQLVATSAYVSWIVLGSTPSPLSLGDWAFLLLPPGVFAVLVMAGIFGIRSDQIVVWQRLLSGFGSLVAAGGLAFSLILLPLGLLGSIFDFAIG